MAQPPGVADYAAFPLLAPSSTPSRRRLRRKCHHGATSFGGPSTSIRGDGPLPYFEPQEAAMCGMHALNHAVGSPAFTAWHLDAAVSRVVDEALAAALEVGAECEETVSNHTAPGGWYSEQVMADALNFQGEYFLDQVPLRAHAAGIAAIWEDDVVGALVHLAGHWVALRRAGSQLWLMDSLAQGPILLATAGDASTEAALQWYASVFLVRTAHPSTPDGVPSLRDDGRQEPMLAPPSTHVDAATSSTDVALASTLESPTEQATAAAAAEAAGRMQGRVWGDRRNSSAAPAAAAAAAEPRSDKPAARDNEQVSSNIQEASVIDVPSAAAQSAQFKAQEATRSERFMRDEFGQERLERDVEELLRRYVKKQDCRQFLRSLPLFAPDDDLKSLVSELDQAVRMLTADQVNSTAALQVRPCLTKTMVYPLLVLMQATAASQGIPVVFFIDVFHGVINSVFNKKYHVRMGRWMSKSRHWWAGTANVGEGKSPGLKSFVSAMVDVLTANLAQAVGYASDRFHYQQSGTTASAVDKLRSCDGYLTICCPDATRCLCPAAATGGSTDPYRYVDLEYFLDAAHGDEFSHITQRMREKVAKEAVHNPAAPVASKPKLHIDPTNVHVLFLQQEVIFANWWAQMTPKKPVGLAQRFLFAFGGDADPAPVAYNNFLDEITLPIVRELFTLIVRRVGPRVTQATEPYVACSDAQADVVAEAENILKLHNRRHDVLETFRCALPKAMYWLGTSILLNTTVGSVWAAALAGEDVPQIPTDVPDGAFATAMRFVHTRYLPGQAVLAVSVKEKIWASREVPLQVIAGDVVPMLVRILRGCPGAHISFEAIKCIDLELKRDLRKPGTPAFAAAQKRLDELWRLIADLGVGQVSRDEHGQLYLRKYHRSALSRNTLDWLEQNRVPGFMHGIGEAAPATKKATKAPSLRGSNPSVTVRATSGAAADAMGAAVPEQSEAAPEAAAPLAQRKQPPPVPKILHSEVVEGILLDRKAARGHMRQVLRARDIVAEVTDVKPLTHERYFLFRGKCLRCRDASQAVVYKGTYYRQSVGVPPKTFTLTSINEHKHPDDAQADSSCTFQPLQELAAKRYIADHTEWSAKGLTNCLVAAGFAQETLPDPFRRRRWLQNHKPKAKGKIEASAPPREELLQRSLQQWPDEETEGAAEIFVVNNPPRVMSSQRVCVPFACRGMMETIRRYGDSIMAVFVDAKQSCMAHGWAVLTCSLLVKDKLRRTSLGRSGGRKVQGNAFTSHALPLVQAIINIEQIENVHQVFETLKRLWAHVCPMRRELENYVVQVHKDWLACLENARLAQFPKSRPMNDFFHLLEKKATIHSKLQQTVLEKKVYKKVEYDWVMAC
ncbi:MAG: hypothetical protein GY772_21820, partial [bacterium]|nr:hypothetical protein [bacterium]